VFSNDKSGGKAWLPVLTEHCKLDTENYPRRKYVPSLFTRTAGNHFLAHNCTVHGAVTMGELSSFWFNAVVRGDVAPIVIGRRVNVQDGAVIHCDSGMPNTIEDDVTIGHRAIVHGAHVGRGSLVGMGSVLLGQTRIGSECLIAAGAVVPPGLVVPDRMVVVGVPGKIARPIRDKELQYLRWLTGHYVALAERYVADEDFSATAAHQPKAPI
jgi:carbonic anhydrase/acetyltransferase-like protein (isoleucine patch superfamily)